MRYIRNIRKMKSILFIGGILAILSLLVYCGKTESHVHTGSESALQEHTHSEETPQPEPAQHAGDHDEAESDPEHSDAEHPSTAGHRHLEISPDIIKQWGIRYTEATEQDYIEKVTLTGVIKENQDTTYIINALVSGIVTAVKKDVGAAVKKGDVLCVLNSPEILDLKTRYIKAFQEYRLTKENFERARKLFDIKAVEQKELISRESAYKTAAADFFSLEAELSTICFDKETLQALKDSIQPDQMEKLKAFLSPYYNILSPGPGKIMMRNLRLGERLETTTPVFEISDTEKMWALLDVLEKDLAYIEKDKPVRVETDVYPGEYFNGRVLTLMQKIDPDLRTLKVRVEVDNKEGRLKPEMYIRGQIEKKLQQKHPAVPEKALVKLSGIDGVFVISDGEFLFKPVQVIDTDAAGFAFVNGIQPGELVISEGAFYLKAEYEIQSGKTDPHAGHGH